jgi:hypothetical protein
MCFNRVRRIDCGDKKTLSLFSLALSPLWAIIDLEAGFQEDVCQRLFWGSIDTTGGIASLMTHI